MHGQSRRWCRTIAALLSLFIVAELAFRVLPHWRTSRGHETLWVAQGLARGEGFSLPVGHRWLFDQVDSDPWLRITDQEWQPSAWADPLYAGILAAMLVVFPRHYQIAAILLNLGLLLLTCWATYRLGERVAGPATGLLALVLVALVRPFHGTVPHMVSAGLGGALIVLAGLALVAALEQPAWGSIVALAIALGVAVLAAPGTQLFVPVAAVLVLLAARQEGLRRASARALVVIAVSAMVVLPWTARNWIRFRELVPVRTGAGQIAFVGVVGAGGAVDPGRLRTRVPPPWRAESARSAVWRLGSWPYAEIAALERFQLDYAADVGPAGYEAMNEAERDAWFMGETRAFVWQAPGLSARLAAAKLELFARRMNWVGTVAAILAPLAWLLYRRPAVLGLSLWVGAYLVPFLMIVPYYERYRTPVEPLIAILAGITLWRLGLGAMHLGRRASP